jgi:hypothetical protein
VASESVEDVGSPDGEGGWTISGTVAYTFEYLRGGARAGIRVGEDRSVDLYTGRLGPMGKFALQVAQSAGEFVTVRVRRLSGKDTITGAIVFGHEFPIPRGESSRVVEEAIWEELRLRSNKLHQEN